MLESVECETIRQALAKHDGNKTAAATELGVTRQTLYNKLKRYNMKI